MHNLHNRDAGFLLNCGWMDVAFKLRIVICVRLSNLICVEVSIHTI
jgi:hypothetical protein